MTATAMRRARSVADLSRGVVHAVVEIAAPAGRVFDALTDGDQVPRWWGSADTYTVTEWTADLRVGGHWKSVGRSLDGMPFSVGGEFLEVQSPRVLVHTWNPDWSPGESTVVRYDLAEILGGTRVTVRHEGFTPNSASCASHGDGWERVLGWLSRFSAPPAPAAYFFCKLLPPRPTFGADMTPDEAKVMGEHVAYWTDLAGRGAALAFGPVADPNGVWGLGIVAAADAAEMKALEAGDPAVRSGRGFRYEVLPMVRLVRGG